MSLPSIINQLSRSSKTIIATGSFIIATGFSSHAWAVNTQVEVQTNKGDFTITLYDEKAPETVKNFLQYVDEGFYEGTIFHRLIPGFMIQGGGFTKELTKKETKKPVKNEASEELKNVRGSVAMARTSSPNSATSQFFINYADNTHLDYRKWNVGYAVFGQLDEAGMEVIDSFSETPTGTISIYKDVPKDAIEIIKITRIQTEAANNEAAESTEGSEEAPTDNTDAPQDAADGAEASN